MVCKCSFQGFTSEGPQNKREQAGQWGQFAGSFLSRTWRIRVLSGLKGVVSELGSSQKVTTPPPLHSIQLSTVQPRHRCSLRTDCRPGTRIQTGLESWRLAEGGGIKVGYRRHRLCSRFKWKWPTPFSQNRLFQIMTRTTATTAKTREWIVNDKCNETVFYVCQHCPQEAWTVVFNHVPLWFESLQVFVPAKHHSSRFHWLLHRQPVRGTNQTNCVP